MEINIRKSIKNNFKDASKDEYKQSINSSIESTDEVILPGLGVFFEVLWENSNENDQDYILNTLKSNIK